jgi:hypothetical protein
MSDTIKMHDTIAIHTPAVGAVLTLRANLHSRRGLGSIRAEANRDRDPASTRSHND